MTNPKKILAQTFQLSLVRILTPASRDAEPFDTQKSRCNDTILTQNVTNPAIFKLAKPVRVSRGSATLAVH